MMHDFYEKLEYSLGEQEQFDIGLLRHIIPGCQSVTKTNVETDRSGIDYIATLRRGAQINIDAKTRERGASRFWTHGEPELALEIWSVVNIKTGWTLDEKSNVDYILYTFDRADTNKFYFLPFQLLRSAFVNNYDNWRSTYIVKKQRNYSWTSEAVFVPASVVLSEINRQMTGDSVLTQLSKQWSNSVSA